MTLNELSSFFNSFLKNEEYDRDISLNGVQVQNSAPDTKEIRKVAFAVDACLETIKRTIQADAQLLFTHHGIFWGSCDTITGSHYNRIAALIQNDVALYASHIPLDANNPYGNNFGMASRLELKDTQPFGTWRGMTLGAIGNLEKPLTADELIAKAFPHGNHSLHLLDLSCFIKNIRFIGIFVKHFDALFFSHFVIFLRFLAYFTDRGRS